MRLAVVILAGGQGSRIGGKKPLRMLGGQRLIDRAEAFARQISDVLAVSVRKSGQVRETALACIADEPGIEGPLGGLAAALQFAHGAGCQAVLTIPADMPFLPTDLAERLVKEIGTAGAAIARSGGHMHPVSGLWSVRVLELLSGYLASTNRSLIGFAERIGYTAVDWSAEPIDPFFNINSAHDLAQAEHLLVMSISSE